MTASRAGAAAGSALFGSRGEGVVYSNSRRFSSSRREAMTARNLSASRAGVVEPVRGPNPVQAPAKAFKNLLPQPIPVSRAFSGVVGCAVAFDTKHKAIWPIGMAHADVYKISSHADLGHGLAAHRTEFDS